MKISCEQFIQKKSRKEFLHDCGPSQQRLQGFTGPLLGNFKYIIAFLSSSPVNWHPYVQIGQKGGVLVHGHKSATRKWV